MDEETKGEDAAPTVRLVRLGLATCLPLLAIAWALDLHRWTGLTAVRPQYIAAVLALALPLAFLTVDIRGRRLPRVPAWDWGLAALAAAASVYLAVHADRLGLEIVYRPVDGIVVAAILLALTLEALRRVAGWLLLGVVAVFLVYGVFGYMLPGILGAREVPLDRQVLYLVIDSNGLLGAVPGIVTTIVVAYVVLGNLLLKTGGAQFFTDLSAALLGRARGGQAKVAVAASALFGSISGSAVANVASTGVITIPLMKQSGFSAERAAAIEAVASTGGQLMPPRMGAAAFLMMDFISVSYAEIVLAALIPSLLYYVALFGYKGKRPSLRTLASVLPVSGMAMVELIAIAGGASFIIAVLNLSGLGFSLTLGLVELANESIVLLLLLAAVICIVLGMGMPTVAVYVLLAALVVPSLIKVGISPIAGHMFVLYFGMMSMVTPPVAIAAFAAATIAGGKPFAAAVESVKLGWTAYIVPFMFVASPTLLFEGPLDAVAWSAVTAILGVWMVSVGTAGFLWRPLAAWYRLAWAVCGLALIVPAAALTWGIGTDLFGLAGGGALLFREYLASRRRPAEAPRPSGA
ncbi:MAG: TRAP transporter large permease subunit [Bauldia litoralis]